MVHQRKIYNPIKTIQNANMSPVRNRAQTIEINDLSRLFTCGV